MVSYEYLIAWRYLIAKRKQTFVSLISIISIAGVAVGVTSLIVVLAVMTGFKEDLKDKILGITSDIMVLSSHGAFGEHDKITKEINKIKGVSASTPFTYSQVMFARQGRATGGILRGIQLVSAKDVLSLDKNIVYGDIESLEIKDDMPRILLGNELANMLNVNINDVIEIISPMGRLTPVGSVPRVMRFKIGGIFKTGMYEFDSTLAYAGIEETARFLGITGKVSGIEVKIDNIYNAPDISKAIQEHLGYPFWTRDWIQMNHNLFAALKLEKIVMFIILTLIIMVASFNIISTLSMMVMEKSKDIGILKSMGATRKSIRNIFMLQGLIIGGIGTIAGVLLSLILCFILGKYQFIELPPDVYYISTLPVKIEWFDVSMVAIAAVVISLFASWYPAVRASKLYPAEALKYE